MPLTFLTGSLGPRLPASLPSPLAPVLQVWALRPLLVEGAGGPEELRRVQGAKP